ncbi:dihydrofolate reductase family protein [Variovorax sp. PAMC26660]|uniref:dihydrofolate reductase family protein n=1 Tax=Variovorax sp. PAMC26660 TaxID=2762322 RepID=UPI00164DD373|nr:dihydrofolate reductase family protein [Variovorax sp. PAMC26660]QNK70460.1 dihydrofolate reductase family protein [Variovorax sp. PAMC26660]
MSSKVFFDVGISLDGYMAGPNAGPDNPMGDGASAMHGWVFQTATFREILGIPGGEQDTSDDALVKRVFARAGAYVLGRRMFDEGEVSWPENAPFRAPVYVLTHSPREPWVRQGGTTFHFVTDGIESALAQAKAAAGGKDVRISGGVHTIRQYIKAGLLDECTIHVAPVLLGAGLRLLDQLAPNVLKLETVSATSSKLVTHLDYRFVR